MRTHLEFRTARLSDGERPDDLPQGERVALLLSSQLPDQGFVVKRVVAEDWGWCITLINAEFPLWIGCGRYLEHDDGYLCFIEPSQPYVRRWLTRISTAEVVESLADAIEATILASADATGLRWWSDQEVRRG